MHLLMIDDRVPDPRLGYGYCRAHRIVAELLEQGHRVSFLPLQRAERREGCDLAMDQVDSFDHARDLLAAIDAVWVSRLSNLRAVRQGAPELLSARRWLYDCEALHSTRNALWAALGHRPAASQITDVAAEAALWRNAAVTIAAARQDAAVLAGHGAAVDEVVGHVISAAPGVKRFAERSGILFLGSFLNFGSWSPNWDALRYIIDTLWPGLQELGATLTVAGHGAARAWAALGRDEPGVVIESDVTDLADLYDRHRVVLAPTRFASGIPWKLHEAFAFGVPAVVSAVLAQQMIAETPHHAGYFEQWSATAPDGYLRAVGTLYRDRQAWEAAQLAALAMVTDGCRPDQFAGGIRRSVERLGGHKLSGS